MSCSCMRGRVPDGDGVIESGDSKHGAAGGSGDDCVIELDVVDFPELATA